MMKLEIKNGQLWLGDCLELMKDIPDNSVDMVLCDLPYGTTACAWDTIIPFAPLWEQYWRICKANSPVVLFGSEPFSSHLRMSAINYYKYDWYWNKKFGGNFVQAKRMPLKSIECVSVFSKQKNMPNYNPQMIDREKPIKQGGRGTANAIPIKNNSETHKDKVYDQKYPLTELNYPREIGQTIHPTQKPILLFEYLIKTYTIEGMLVLDNCSGSGTTAMAAEKSNRRWICIEKDQEYFEMSRKRIKFYS